MKRQIVILAAVLSAVATLALSGGAGRADAAPGSSVRVCAVWANGRTYVGPVTLVNRNIWEIGRTLRTSPRGCINFNGVQPGKAYRAVVNYEAAQCAESRRADGSTFRYGRQETVVGSSPWKVARRGSQVDLGKFTANLVTKTCN